MYILILCAYFVGVCSAKLEGERKAFLEMKVVFSVLVMLDHTLIFLSLPEEEPKGHWNESLIKESRCLRWLNVRIKT